MEQQEEKKRKEHKSTSSFPMDLTSEILLRLPEKSLLRFCCVLKLWSSIITDPYFINLFETRYPRPSLLLCFRKDGNLFVSSIQSHSKISNKSYSSSQPTDCYQMEFPGDVCNTLFTKSVHGLICFLGSDDTPIVWNPSKREFLTLPKPNKMSFSDKICIVLGYDPIEGKHKLVCIPVDRDCNVCKVLTLGSAQESWRTVKTKHPSYLKYYSHGRCIKGVIYYQVYISKTRVWTMMSFDVRSELFDMIQLPSDVYDCMMMMRSYEGKLTCVKEQTMKGYSYNTATLCILEDAEKHQWSRKDFLAPFTHYDQSLGTRFHLRGITHVDEFIYAPSYFRKSSYILFCDPVRTATENSSLKE